MSSMLSLPMFLVALAGAVLGAAATAYVLLRRYERMRRDLDASHRQRVAALEKRGWEVVQHIEQLRERHRDDVQVLERRIEHQLKFDPHHWLAQAQALRADGRETAAINEFYAGLQRTRAALGRAFWEMALHHYVVRVGLPVAAMAAHLTEAERCVQLAVLLDSDDRMAAQIAEDIAAALDELRLAQQQLDEQERTAPDERVFLGEPDHRRQLIDMLVADARVAADAGRHAVAQRLAHRALTLAAREFGGTAAITAVAREIYASTLAANGEYAEARTQIDAALSNGGGDDTRLRSMRAEVAARLGQWDRALGDLDALCGDCTRTLGAEHLETLSVRRDRALASSALGQHDAALVEIDALLSILEHIADPEEPDVTRAHMARAEILHALGRNDDAFGEVERVFLVAERIFGVEHPVALHLRWLRALILHALHREDEALDDIESLLDTQRYVFGDRHPDALQSAALRARIMQALGRRQEALVEARRLLALHASSLGDEHRGTVQLHGLVSELEAA